MPISEDAFDDLQYDEIAKTQNQLNVRVSKLYLQKAEEYRKAFAGRFWKKNAGGGMTYYTYISGVDDTLRANCVLLTLYDNTPSHEFHKNSRMNLNFFNNLTEISIDEFNAKVDEVCGEMKKTALDLFMEYQAEMAEKPINL